MMTVYLASASPRRRQLLTEAGCAVRVVPSSYREPNELVSDPRRMVMDQALGKARGADPQYRQRGLVLGADTIVVLDGRCLGKPADAAEAVQMLRDLSGREHEVITGAAFLRDDEEKVIAVTTVITFHKLREEQIAAYVATGSPLDKAGAYGLQDLDDTWIARVKGSYTNVVGLPMEAVAEVITLQK